MIRAVMHNGVCSVCKEFYYSDEVLPRNFNLGKSNIMETLGLPVSASRVLAYYCFSLCVIYDFSSFIIFCTYPHTYEYHVYVWYADECIIERAGRTEFATLLISLVIRFYSHVSRTYFNRKKIWHQVTILCSSLCYWFVLKSATKCNSFQMLPNLRSILGAFAKLQKVIISFDMFVCPSAWSNSAPTGRIFMKFYIWKYFWLMTNLTHSFLMYLFHASTCFEQQVLIIRRAKLY
jgi:hypothetical protein